MLSIDHINLELPQRRMVQKETAQGRVMVGLDHFAHAPVVAHRCRLSATRPVQPQPMSAVFEPLPEEAVLGFVGERTGDIGHQQLTPGQPFVDVAEVPADRGRDIGLFM